MDTKVSKQLRMPMVLYSSILITTFKFCDVIHSKEAYKIVIVYARAHVVCVWGRGYKLWRRPSNEKNNIIISYDKVNTN